MNPGNHMNNHRMMRSLMWKDIRTVRPLVLTAVITAVVANLLVWLCWRQGEMLHDTMVGFCYTVWFVLPGLVALGVPAMLVGTEHDTGTENWLRSLPVPWYMIARAKLWIGAGAVVLTGAVTTIAFLVMWQAWEQPARVGFQPNAPPLIGMIAVLAIFAFFIFLLLLLGFVWSYLIRSSLVSMLALVPTFFLAISMAATFESQTSSLPAEAQLTVNVLAALAALFLVWALQMILARRRYLLPLGNWVPAGTSESPASPGYHPSRLPVLTQPSPVMSLLWQQLRQTGPTSVALVAISAVLAFVFAVTQSAIGHNAAAGFLSLIPMFILLSASWLGAIAFYGDTVQHRCAFFADRGISPTRIWWTRIVPPSIACLVLLTLIGMVAMSSRAVDSERLWPAAIQVAALMVVLFSFGQLVSQWVDRPLLAFLAAPAYACICLSPVLYMLARFNAEFAVIILMAPVLIFATWRLTRYWLMGQVQSTFSAQVLGYSALAVLAPCLWIAMSQVIVPISNLYAAWIPGVTP